MVENAASPSPAEREDSSQRTLPVGAEILSDGGVHFRVWAPRRRQVAVVTEGDTVTLEADGSGYFAASVHRAKAGTLYRFRLDDDDRLYPDPASRCQPEGVDGPSMLVDPRSFRWTDGDWRGVGRHDLVLYELHVGTFTHEGTWEAATRELPELASLGVTVIAMMPVAEFSGRFGWGYDGVGLFAPTRLYGSPDSFRRFVDQAHGAGIGVILDVVYNHLGPAGNYLKDFSVDYFTDRYENEWGEAINFDGPNSGPVREFFLSNARYWIEEFHLDGLRLDATQQMFDRSSENIVAAVARVVRETAPGRSTLIIGENEPQDAKLVHSPAAGGYGLDAVWNDDFHHSAMVALTGRREAYYTDYLGNPQEFVSTAKWGFLYQGQRYKWQNRRRGTPSLDIEPAAFVNYLQNHDQVANSARGRRVHLLTSPGRYRAMTAFLLLAPGTPMLFQGQEFAASTPFTYFADHDPGLAAGVRKGRREFLAQFRSLKAPEIAGALPDPGDPAMFEQCKLNLSERESQGEIYALHRDLLALRRNDPVFSARIAGGIDGAVLGPEAFLLRYFFHDRDGDRLLIVNLGRDLHLDPAPEPLLVPPPGGTWTILWSSESPDYGGRGTAPLETEENWRIPGQAAVVLRAGEPEEQTAE
ncbi:malto-oligosyltrehalose trehalohydrolase [Virgifigura deserti]|uniref:malto-oligosyltrehalose trehalohydrolase n=1 Tax=Virgifigura deserti TaxID=2268457 RepID=UPI003CCC439D